MPRIPREGKNLTVWILISSAYCTILVGQNKVLLAVLLERARNVRSRYKKDIQQSYQRICKGTRCCYYS